MKQFKPPKDHRVCLQYFRTKQDGSKEILAYVVEPVLRTGTFILYLPDSDGWKKAKTSQYPDFDKEVYTLYENAKTTKR